MGLIGKKKIGMGFLKALILSKKRNQRMVRDRWLNNYYISERMCRHRQVNSITINDLLAKDWIFISEYYEEEPLIATANSK